MHVIDGTSPDPIGDYNAIRTELELFNPALIEKPEVCTFPILLSVMSSDACNPEEPQCMLRLASLQSIHLARCCKSCGAVILCCGAVLMSC